jgi:hypothetical protein
MKIFNIIFFTIISFFSYSQCVSGDCENGFGKFKYDNESFYQGNWKNGLKHGRGLDFQIDSINRKYNTKAFTKKLGLFENNQLIEGNKEVFSGSFSSYFTITFKSFFGKIIKQSNLYKFPENGSEIIKKFNYDNKLFVISNKPINGFYNVIDPISADMGYIDQSSVILLDEIKDINRQLLNPSGISESLIRSQITIFNDADTDLTIKIAGSTYKFYPNEKKSFDIEPGNYTIIAWHTGANPYRGNQIVESGQNYDTSFYIIYN